MGPRVPVHGLLVDIESGRLEWLVNGYQALATASFAHAVSPDPSNQPLDTLKQMLPFNLGEMKFPEGKIGDLATKAEVIIGRVERAASRAEHLTGKAGEFAEKVGNLADKATHWINEVRIHGHEAEPPTVKPPPLKLQTPKPSPSKRIPVPPPIQRPPHGGKR